MTRLLFMVAFAVAFLSTQDSQAQRIKLATLAPEGTSYYEALREMGDAWHEISNGSITVTIFPGGIAGDEGDIVRKMRIGQLQAAAITGGGISDITPTIRALQMPMMFSDYDELDYVRDRVSSKIEGAIAARGFRVLGWADAGWIYFFSQEPVVHPDDMKSMKLFTWTANTTFLEAWKDLGYQPVPMSATDIHLGLASKLINVIAVPPIGALSFQWFGLASHMTDLKFAPLVGAIMVTAKAWDQIPMDLRPQLEAAARETSEHLRGARNLNDQAIKVMQEHGLTVHPVPENIRAIWEERARAAYPRLVGNAIPADLVAEIESLRDEYRQNRAR